MEVFGVHLETWQIWVILGVIAFIAEIFIPGFVTACLGIGLFLGGLADLIGLSLSWQLFFFSAGTVLSFLAIRPLILKWGYNQEDKIKTNADSLTGKIGRVSQEINTLKGTGRVAIDGDDWAAKSEKIIPQGSLVEVVARESIVLKVKEHLEL